MDAASAAQRRLLASFSDCPGQRLQRQHHESPRQLRRETVQQQQQQQQQRAEHVLQRQQCVESPDPRRRNRVGLHQRQPQRWESMEHRESQIGSLQHGPLQIQILQHHGGSLEHQQHRVETLEHQQSRVQSLGHQQQHRENMDNQVHPRESVENQQHRRETVEHQQHRRETVEHQQHRRETVEHQQHRRETVEHQQHRRETVEHQQHRRESLEQRQQRRQRMARERRDESRRQSGNSVSGNASKSSSSGSGLTLRLAAAGTRRHSEQEQQQEQQQQPEQQLSRKASLDMISNSSLASETPSGSLADEFAALANGLQALAAPDPAEVGRSASPMDAVDDFSHLSVSQRRTKFLGGAGAQRSEAPARRRVMSRAERRVRSRTLPISVEDLEAAVQRGGAATGAAATATVGDGDAEAGGAGCATIAERALQLMRNQREPAPPRKLQEDDEELASLRRRSSMAADDQPTAPVSVSTVSTASTEAADSCAFGVSRVLQQWPRRQASDVERRAAADPPATEGDCEGEVDELCRLSLSEKRQMFLTKASEPKAPPECGRRARRLRNKTTPVTLDDVANLFLKDQGETQGKDAGETGADADKSELSLSLTGLLAANDSGMAQSRAQDLPSPDVAAVRLRGKAAEGIQRWSSFAAKEPSPPPPAPKESPTRGRPISERMSQLQASSSESDRQKKPSPWASSVGKRLNFREQSRQSRSLDEEQENEADEAENKDEDKEQRDGGGKREAKQYKSRSSTAPLPGAGSGVAERMKALQRSGEESWRQRVTPRASPERPRSQIAELQSQLIKEENVGWRKKQQPGSTAEARSLTVKSKLGEQACEEAAELLNSLLADAHRRTAPRRSVACSPLPDNAGAESRPSSLCAEADQSATVSAMSAEPASEFFPTYEPAVDEAPLEDQSVDVDESPTAEDEPQPEQLVQLRRKPLPQNRRRGQRNPVRARAQLARESTPPAESEADNGMAEPPEARQSANQGLAKEAIEGLQTKVDFDSISLQKMDPLALVKPFGSMANPYKDLMLLQVKGRRLAQARLVAPCGESMSNGDCYLLMTRDCLYLWQGLYANVIEVNKANELAKWILEKRDLGYAGTQSEPFLVHSEDTTSSRALRFWRLLGHEGPQETRSPLAEEEDIVYEQLIADTNAFYRVDTTACALVPLEDHWGRAPSHRLLCSADAIVCDFGAELYLWCGRRADRRARRLGVELAQRLFADDYDYEGCLLCPIHPALPPAPQCPRRGPRPDWCLLGKVNQQGETVLFREKFSDWPDTHGLLGSRHRPASQSESTRPPDWLFDACSAAEMLDTWQRQEPACLELEGSRLGRGGQWTEVVDGLRRSFEVVTLSTRAWQVTLDFERRELPPEAVGQLHSGNTFLVRWQYRLIVHGKRSSAVTGRERCAYFYWQGAGSGQKEKGAGALLTVELDAERCPQVQVVEGEETPAFLRIFDGAAVVHAGSRDDTLVIGAQVAKLFLLRGHSLDESLLSEVPCRLESLRPRGCFLLVASGGRGFVWLGRSTAAWYRDLAAARATVYASATPKEMRLGGVGVADWTTVRQGAEPRDFLRALGARPAAAAESAESSFADPAPIRAYKFTSATRTGELQFSLLPDIAAHPGQVTPFPHQQATLRALPQPANAFVLVDCGDRLFLWQGWNPMDGDSGRNSFHAGSSLTRFEAEKRAVLKTALEYGKLAGIDAYQQQLVYAGAEPIEFQQLFPSWQADGQSDAGADAADRTLQSLYERLNNLAFDLATLQSRPLPEGVDPSRLEAYLDDDSFEEAFQTSRAEFDAMSDWKKLEMKKALGLY